MDTGQLGPTQEEDDLISTLSLGTNAITAPNFHKVYTLNLFVVNTHTSFLHAVCACFCMWVCGVVEVVAHSY